MRLENDLLGLLTRATTVARLMGIEDLSMEDNPKGKMIRGMVVVNETPVVMIQPIADEVEMPFESLAIISTQAFTSRMQLAVERDQNFRTVIEIDDRTNNVSRIDFKGTRFKMQFMAGQAATVRAPKVMKDPDTYTFSIEKEDVDAIAKAVKAMGGENILFVSDGEELSFEVRSGKSDVFSCEIGDEVVNLAGDDDTTFAFNYRGNTMLTLLRNCESNTFTIGRQGVFTGDVQGINIHIFPRNG